MNIYTIRVNTAQKANFFKKLDQEKKEITNIVTNFSEELIAKEYSLNVKRFKFSKNISTKQKYNFEEILKYHKTSCYSKRSLEIVKRFLFFLETLKDHIDLLIIWDGTRIYERTAIEFARKYKKKYYVIENGYFRPFTIMFDSKGANYDSTIPRNIEFYKKIKNDSLKFQKYKHTPLIIEKQEKLKKIQNKNIHKVFAFIFSLEFSKIKKIQKICNHFYIKIKNQIFFKEKLLNYKKERYVFIPFQVESDSQIILYSPKIKKMYDLVEVVLKNIEKYNKNTGDNLKAIFKLHPMDNDIDLSKFRKFYKNELFHIFKEENTMQLLKNSQLVITINSTVGIEALLEEKNVITLGNAFYNIKGIVNECKELKKLDKLIKISMTTKKSKELIEKFLYYLRFDYFTEVYIENPTKVAIENLKYKYLKNFGEK